MKSSRIFKQNKILVIVLTTVSLHTPPVSGTEPPGTRGPPWPLCGEFGGLSAPVVCRVTGVDSRATHIKARLTSATAAQQTGRGEPASREGVSIDNLRDWRRR